MISAPAVLPSEPPRPRIDVVTRPKSKLLLDWVRDGTAVDFTDIAVSNEVFTMGYSPKDKEQKLKASLNASKTLAAGLAFAGITSREFEAAIAPSSVASSSMIRRSARTATVF